MKPLHPTSPFLESDDKTTQPQRLADALVPHGGLPQCGAPLSEAILIGAKQFYCRFCKMYFRMFAVFAVQRNVILLRTVYVDVTFHVWLVSPAPISAEELPVVSNNIARESVTIHCSQELHRSISHGGGKLP
jgi:hypothetical protein